MPMIEQIKIIDGEPWIRLKLDRPTDSNRSVSVWTEDELKRDRISTVRQFLRDLGDKYIEQQWPGEIQ